MNLYSIAGEAEEDKSVQKKAIKKLIESKNIAADMDVDELRVLGDLVITELEADEGNPQRQDKINRWEEGERLARQQKTRNNSVWSDTHYPLLIDACIKFNAHALPVIMRGGKVVKKKIIGREKKETDSPPQPTQPAQMQPGAQIPQNPPGPQMPAGAQMQQPNPSGQQIPPVVPGPPNLLQQAGLSGEMPKRSKSQVGDDLVEYLNYQFSTEMSEWTKDTDKLLLRLAAYGVMYRKIWYSKVKSRPCSRIISPLMLIIPPGEGLAEAQRISEYFFLTPNEIKSYVRSGLFEDFVYRNNAYEDSEEPQEFVEQRRWIDLDEDGYKEPYIVTVHKDTGSVCRIVANYGISDVQLGDGRKVARITPQSSYVEYTFIESIEDDGLPLGFYDLLTPVNNAINKATNQMIDASMLASSNSGFIAKNLQLATKSNKVTMKVGHFNAVNATGQDIRSGIVQMQYPGPNPVLFSLIQFLLSGAKELANTQNIMESAQTTANMPATTTMALIEQGAKVSNSIYKRIYRSLHEEFKILKRLNAENLKDSQYIRIIDAHVTAEDFRDPSHDVEPIADPEEISDLQRLSKAQFLLSLIALPSIDARKVTLRILEAANISSPEDLMAQPQQPQQDPRIEMEKLKMQLAQARLQIEQGKLQLEQQKSQREGMAATMELDLANKELQIKQREAESKITRNKTASISDLAEAEAKEAGSQLAMYQQRLTELEALHNAKKQQAERDRAAQELALKREQQLYNQQQLAGNPATAPGAGDNPGTV